MTRAVVYARKSTDDDNPDETKSVQRQTDSAAGFIARQKGWTLVRTYTDDGISGAIFTNRPQFQKMMRDARAHLFDAIVFFDLDRLGRHARYTMAALYELVDDLKISVWDASGARIDLESFEGRVSTSLKTEFAQQFREQIAKHTHSGMKKKAELGWATGGRAPFGYAYATVGDHLEWKIKESEAAIVRQIYERFAAGTGARTIAAWLNESHIPQPRAASSGWSGQSVKAILERSIYRGEIVWGRVKNTHGGKRENLQVPTAPETWTRTRREELRIIPQELADRCDQRRVDSAERYHASIAKGGPVPERAHGRFLLSGGLLICPTCHKHFELVRTPWKPLGEYVCSTRRRKKGFCSNMLALPMQETDDILLDAVEGHNLGATVIEDLLSLVDQGDADRNTYLTADLERLQAEVKNLVTSIASGVPASTVASAIRERESQIGKIERQLDEPRQEPVNIERLRAALEQRSAEWKSELRGQTQIARLVIRRLIGPLVLHNPTKASPEWIAWEAEFKPGLLDGLVAIPQRNSET